MRTADPRSHTFSDLRTRTWQVSTGTGHKSVYSDATLSLLDTAEVGVSTNRNTAADAPQKTARRLATDWLDGKIEQAGKTFGAIFFIDEVERLKEIRRLLARPKLARRRRGLSSERSPGT